MSEKRTFTPEETAEVLGISVDLCYRKLRDGTLPSFRLGHRWIIPRVALDNFLASAFSPPAGGAEGEAGKGAPTPGSCGPAAAGAPVSPLFAGREDAPPGSRSAGNRPAPHTFDPEGAA